MNWLVMITERDTGIVLDVFDVYGERERVLEELDAEWGIYADVVSIQVVKDE